MAKRGSAAKGGFVMAQEILTLVQGNKSIKGPEVLAVLKEKFPKIEINNASCQVAYANARRKLGLTRTIAKIPAAFGNIALLQSAKTLLEYCDGDTAAAIEALNQVASLQMG